YRRIAALTDARDRVPRRAVERHIEQRFIATLLILRIPGGAWIDEEPVGVAVDEVAVIVQGHEGGVARGETMRSADPQVIVVLRFERRYRRSVTPARRIDDEFRMRSEEHTSELQSR